MENEGIDKKEIEWYNRNDSCEGTAFFSKAHETYLRLSLPEKKERFDEKGYL